MELTGDERDVLHWLGQEEVSQYGDCYGPELDILIEKGLAEVHGEQSGLDNPFVAKGRSLLFRAVSLTDAGRAELSSELTANPGGDNADLSGHL